MLIAYRIVKGALIAAVLSLLILMLVRENTRTDGAPPRPDSPPALTETARDFLLHDPYDRRILSRVAEQKRQSRALFSGILSSVSNLIARPDFYNNVFIFMVSKRSDGIARLVSEEFTNLAAFDDLVILDRDDFILYKHGNTSFITANYPAAAGRVIVNADELAVTGRYHDPTLDAAIRIVALFSPERIASELRRQTYPGFLVLRDRVYTNDAPPQARNVIPLALQNRVNERKYSIGNSVVETVSIDAETDSGREVFGSLGIVYPARKLGDIVLVLLKVAGLVALVLGFIALDGLLEKAVLAADIRRKKKQSAYRAPKAPRVRPASPDSRNAETNLDWVQDYINGTEKQKKGDKE